jgi:hypothetical protein
MNRYCWDPGSYTAFSFACVPTGDVELMLHYSYILIFYAFCSLNILHINNDCTVKNRTIMSYVSYVLSYKEII